MTEKITSVNTVVISLTNLKSKYRIDTSEGLKAIQDIESIISLLSNQPHQDFSTLVGHLKTSYQLKDMIDQINAEIQKREDLRLTEVFCVHHTVKTKNNKYYTSSKYDAQLLIAKLLDETSITDYKNTNLKMSPLRLSPFEIKSTTFWSPS